MLNLNYIFEGFIMIFELLCVIWTHDVLFKSELLFFSQCHESLHKKHERLAQYWFNGGTASKTTLCRHSTNIGPISYFPGETFWCG